MSEPHSGLEVNNDAINIEGVDDDISDVNWLDLPVLIILLVLIVLVSVQFFTRYVLNDSLGWTEEIARYFLIALGFVGSVSCVRKGKHIYLEFFYRHIPREKIKLLAISSEAICGLFYGAFAWMTIGLAEKTSAQSMVSIDLPKSVIYYVVVFSATAMCGFSLAKLISLVRTPSSIVAAHKLEIKL